MAQVIEATYSEGMLRPDVPLDLRESQRVRLTIEPLFPLNRRSEKNPCALKGRDPRHGVHYPPATRFMTAIETNIQSSLEPRGITYILRSSAASIVKKPRSPLGNRGLTD